MNITDIDDKTIKRSIEELTEYYKNIFLDDLEDLNILKPKHLLSAREYIKGMIEMVSDLLKKGIAYKAKDGVYFSIEKFKGYGKIANIKIDSNTKERITNDNYDKDNARDFALWKFHTENDKDIFYEAEFGKGRPGWHIECSVMAKESLGETIDIHTGGIDLLFPHHTNEIAQSEASTGKKFVNYWIHGAFVNISGDKMSKSKGNFLKLQDIRDAGISPLAFRYWLLTSHYRTPINFTLETLKASQTAFLRLLEAFIDISNNTKNGALKEHVHEHKHDHKHNDKHSDFDKEIIEKNSNDYQMEFEKAISDDFNIPEALALTWNLIKDHHIENKDKLKLLKDFDKVFGLNLNELSKIKEDTRENDRENIPEEIKALVEVREEARKNKEWDKADAIRKEIEDRGYIVKDGENGSEIRMK
jgi:cysteinyl-tRNA synthetase